MSHGKSDEPENVGGTIKPREYIVQKTFLPLGDTVKAFAPTHIYFSGHGKVSEATAAAVSSASFYVGDEDRRSDWFEMFEQLSRLEPKHLQVLTELKEPVLPQLEVLIKWRPKYQSEATIRIAAAAVLSDKREAEARSHGRTVAWIGVVGAILAVAVGFFLGRLSMGSAL